MEVLQQASASIAEEEATASENDSERNRIPEPELELPNNFDFSLRIQNSKNHFGFFCHASN